jgi:hypothetical protein
MTGKERPIAIMRLLVVLSRLDRYRLESLATHLVCNELAYRGKYFELCLLNCVRSIKPGPHWARTHTRTRTVVP